MLFRQERGTNICQATGLFHKKEMWDATNWDYENQQRKNDA
jgi:hypothetical protein